MTETNAPYNLNEISLKVTKTVISFFKTRNKTHGINFKTKLCSKTLELLHCRKPYLENSYKAKLSLCNFIKTEAFPK